MIAEDSRRMELAIKRRLWIVTIGLLLSGITALPIETELMIGRAVIDFVDMQNEFSNWIVTVHNGVAVTNAQFPFVAYGTDWLAFAHIVFAILFIGPLKDPIRNIWVVEFGIISCIAIVPFAFIAGHIRGIPTFWQLIDCSFGIVCGSILVTCRNKIKILAHSE